MQTHVRLGARAPPRSGGVEPEVLLACGIASTRTRQRLRTPAEVSEQGPRERRVRDGGHGAELAVAAGAHDGVDAVGSLQKDAPVETRRRPRLPLLDRAAQALRRSTLTQRVA